MFNRRLPSRAIDICLPEMIVPANQALSLSIAAGQLFNIS